MSVLSRASLAALAAACAWPAAAQTVPQPTREEIERPAPPAPAPERGRLDVVGGVERAPCALDRPEYRDISFTLREAQFGGMDGIDPELLRPAWAPYAGETHNVAAICAIRDRAAALLEAAGYIAAVEVPEQRIADGLVRFEVVAARLIAVRVRGDAGRAERSIAAYLERLATGRPFNRFEAERYLLLAGDLPGYQARLALRSAQRERGEVIGEVTVRRIPAAADVSIQNLGSREIGRWGALLRGQLFGLTGLGDRTSIALFSTADPSEQQTLQVAHDFRIGGEGLAFGAQATWAWATPDVGLPNARFDSRTFFATIEASYPLVRRQAETVRLAAGLDIVDQDVTFNALPLNRERLRVGFVRLAFAAADPAPPPGYIPGEAPWQIEGFAEARRGLSLLGASEGCGPLLARCLLPGIIPPSRLEGDPTATVLRAGLSAEARPASALGIAFGVRAQHAGNPLYAFEEFSAGNYTIGRGYDPGTLMGDSGIGVQAELRYGSLRPPRANAVAFQPFLFIERAWVWNEDRLGGGPRRQTLASAGGGLRAAFGDQARLELSLAVPLERAGLRAERPDPRVLLSFTSRLWPWSFR